MLFLYYKGYKPKCSATSVVTWALRFSGFVSGTPCKSLGDLFLILGIQFDVAACSM